MEITEFDVSLQQLVTRTLTQEEADMITFAHNKGLNAVKYNIDDTYEDKIASVTAQYIELGYSQEKAEELAVKFVR